MKDSDNGFLVKLRVLGLLLFMAAIPFSSFAQDPKEEDEIDLLLDELFFNEDQFIDEILESLTKNPFIYTSVTYNSNTYFTGRDSGIDQFHVLPQISYYHPSGLNASVSGMYYENFDPKWDFTNVYLGYYNTFDKKELINYSIGYAHYFYSDGSNTFTNSLSGGIGIKNNGRTLGANVTASYLFGGDEAFQLIPSVYGRFSLIKGKGFSIKFVPRLSMIVAQQTIALEQLNSQTDETEFINYDVFDLLNTQLNLPISLISKSWNLDVGYNINFPNPVATETDLKNTSYFTVSLGYLINMKRM